MYFETYKEIAKPVAEIGWQDYAILFGLVVIVFILYAIIKKAIKRK